MTLSNLINLHDLDGPSDHLTVVDGAPSAGGVANTLRAGLCPSDRAFDRLLPRALRVVSGQYWTPVVAAVRAAEWFEQLNIGTVVDIGSGAGKFCVVAALAGHARFTGLEQRPRLVSAARNLAHALELNERVTFVHGTLGESHVPEADAYYLYNPFGENLFGPDDHLDQEVELGYARYLRDIAFVEQLLRDAPIGTHLLTYNGFGGQVPATYHEVFVDRALPNVLRLWRKMNWTSAGQPHYAEAL